MEKAPAEEEHKPRRIVRATGSPAGDTIIIRLQSLPKVILVSAYLNKATKDTNRDKSRSSFPGDRTLRLRRRMTRLNSNNIAGVAIRVAVQEVVIS